MQRVFKAMLMGCLLLGSTTVLQAQMESPTPAPELKQLDFLVGYWTAQGTVDLSVYKLPADQQQGGKFSYTFHNEWLPGKFFLIGREHYDIPGQGKSAVLTVYAYDSKQKVFTHTLYRGNVGEVEATQFTMDGDTWHLSSEDQIEGKPAQGRFTMKVLSPTAYTMKYEVSADGKAWSTVLMGKATKQ